jgi:hypothetical protein
MKKVEDLRITEVHQEDGTWVKLISMGQLEVGDVFRMFEATGEAVLDRDGKSVFVCIKVPAVEADSATILDIV